MNNARGASQEKKKQKKEGWRRRERGTRNPVERAIPWNVQSKQSSDADMNMERAIPWNAQSKQSSDADVNVERAIQMEL